MIGSSSCSQSQLPLWSGFPGLCPPLHDWHWQLFDFLQLAVRIWMTDTEHASHKRLKIIRRPHFQFVQMLCQLLQNPN